MDYWAEVDSSKCHASVNVLVSMQWLVLTMQLREDSRVLYRGRLSSDIHPGLLSPGPLNLCHLARNTVILHGMVKCMGEICIVHMHSFIHHRIMMVCAEAPMYAIMQTGRHIIFIAWLKYHNYSTKFLRRVYYIGDDTISMTLKWFGPLCMLLQCSVTG